MLKGLKNMFFEEDPNVASSKPQETQSVSAPVVSPISTYTAAPAVSYTEGIPDQKFLEFFNNLLTEANIPGPDYFEFRKNLESTANISASVAEPVRFMMVYSMMSGSGLTKAVLLETAQKYLTYLEEKHNEGLQEIEAKRDAEISTREAKLNELKLANEERSKKIADLSLEIQKSQEEQGVIQGEIATNGAKLEQQKKNYEASYVAFKSTIETDITKIQTNIN